MIHYPVSVVSQFSLIAWLNGLASGDQRRLTESGSALEAITRNALYKCTFTLFYFQMQSVLAERYVDARLLRSLFWLSVTRVSSA